MWKRIAVILIIIAATITYATYQKRTLESQISLKPTEEEVLKKLPPNLEFETLDGEEFRVDEVKADLLIVHFWGTWCAPCEAELPELLNFIQSFEKRPGMKFLLVAANDEALKVKKHIAKLPKAQVTWLLDNKQVHRDIFGTTRVPETFVFSSDKVTLRKFVGPQAWSKDLYFQTFDEFLQLSTRRL